MARWFDKKSLSPEQQKIVATIEFKKLQIKTMTQKGLESPQKTLIFLRRINTLVQELNKIDYPGLLLSTALKEASEGALKLYDATLQRGDPKEIADALPEIEPHLKTNPAVHFRIMKKQGLLFPKDALKYLSDINHLAKTLPQLTLSKLELDDALRQTDSSALALFFDILRRGDKDEIDKAIPEIETYLKKENLNILGNKGNAFNYAVEAGGEMHTIPAFIERKAPKLEEKYSEAFYYALFSILRDLRVDINAKNSFFEQPALVTAVAIDNMNAFNALLKLQGVPLDLNLTCNEAWQSSTALIMAVQRGNKEAIKQLLSRGAEIDKPARYGLTALHWAAIMLDYEAMQLLLDKGADPNAKTDEGRTPLDYLHASKDDTSYLKEMEEDLKVPANTRDSNRTTRPEFRPIMAHFWVKRDNFMDYLKMKIKEDNARELCQNLLLGKDLKAKDQKYKI